MSLLLGFANVITVIDCFWFVSKENLPVLCLWNVMWCRCGLQRQSMMSQDPPLCTGSVSRLASHSAFSIYLQTFFLQIGTETLHGWSFCGKCYCFWIGVGMNTYQIGVWCGFRSMVCKNSRLWVADIRTRYAQYCLWSQMFTVSRCWVGNIWLWFLSPLL